MSQFSVAIVLIAGLSLFATSSHAGQSNSQAELETIIVTASRTPTSFDDVGASISVISQEDIRRQGYRNLADLLRSVPGFAVSQQGGAGTLTQVRVRGAEANQVLVLINGIEANDISQGSEFNFAHMMTDNINRVEIVRGPQSSLWGSDAVAGVVNVITNTNVETSGMTLIAESGSFNTLKGGAGFNYAGAGTRVGLSIYRLETDGTNISRSGNETDGYDNTTLDFSARTNLSDDVAIDVVLRGTDVSTDFDDIDFFTTGLPIDAAFVTLSTQRYGKVALDWQVSDITRQQFILARTDNENVNRTNSPVDDVTSSTRDSLHAQTDFLLGDQVFSFVAEHEREDYAQRGLATFFGDPNKSHSANTTSVAAEYKLNRERYNLSASARHDNNSEFENANTWRLTGLFRLTGNTDLFGSVGKSAKNPTFTERFGFYDTFIGNPALRPEVSLGWELGVRDRRFDDRLQLSASYFDATIDDEINGFVFDTGTFGFTAANEAGESKRSGVEVELYWLATDALSLTGSYTFLDATEPVFGGERIEVRRPENMASLRANYAFAQANLNLGVTYNGAQFDDYFPPFPPYQEQVQLKGYTLVDLAFSYRVNNKVTLTARVDNARDENYEDVYGFATPGVGAYAGIRVAL